MKYLGDLTTGESLDGIAREHPGPYHVIEVRAWMHNYAETPLREVYYDREIARARELQVVRIIDETIAGSAEPPPAEKVAVLLANYSDGSGSLSESVLGAFRSRAAADDAAAMIEQTYPSKSIVVVEASLT